MRILFGLFLLAFPLSACGGSQGDADTSAADEPPVESVEAVEPENLQIVQVSVEGDAYIFSPASVRAGDPVRLVFDPAGLPGCSKDVAIPDFQVAKVISAGMPPSNSRQKTRVPSPLRVPWICTGVPFWWSRNRTVS